jgi:hypothetical protein
VNFCNQVLAGRISPKTSPWGRVENVSVGQVADGSADWAARRRGRIKLVRSRNLGIAKARNLGQETARAS